jgi:hypothetical protein
MNYCGRIIVFMTANIAFEAHYNFLRFWRGASAAPLRCQGVSEAVLRFRVAAKLLHPDGHRKLASMLNFSNCMPVRSMMCCFSLPSASPRKDAIVSLPAPHGAAQAYGPRIFPTKASYLFLLCPI